MKVFPVFMPFMGCPYRCVYCNQYATTPVKIDTRDVLKEAEVTVQKLAERVISGAEKPSEIAFYGGTFTALPVETMKGFLDLASAYVEKGIFTGIRFSTRPDRLGDEILEILRDYPIATVELGAQSLDDFVLRVSRRGYESRVVYEAASRVKSMGWKLGIQLMPGLPGDTFETFRKSVNATCAIKPEFVRLYPTVVVKDTVLERWYRDGSYKPLSLKEAIRWCVYAYGKFEGSGIKVIRMGLQATEDLNRDSFVAGPYHPAFGHLVKVHLWRDSVDEAIASIGPGASISVLVPEKYLSECIGPRRINIRYWKKRWQLKSIVVKHAETCESAPSNKKLLSHAFSVVIES